jgi:hypothetical protein
MDIDNVMIQDDIILEPMYKVNSELISGQLNETSLPQTKSVNQIIQENRQTQILNNFALLYKNFEDHKKEGSIFVLTSWVQNINGKFRPFEHGYPNDFRASKYNFCVKVFLDSLFLQDDKVIMRLKILHIIESEISNFKKNDYILLSIGQDNILTPMSYITVLFSSYFKLSKCKNNIINLYGHDNFELKSINGINYLSLHLDNEDNEPNYFDLEELKEKINNKMTKDLAQLEIIKTWIYEKRDIGDIIKELKRFIRELEK